MKMIVTGLVSLSALGAALTVITAQAQTDAAPSTTAVSEDGALATWSKIYEVFSHPRCANCHVPDDNRPRWSGPSYGLADGEWKYHGMNINGGESRIGIETLPCSTCHGAENVDTPHGPPGAEVWALAPVEMLWWRQSSAQICQQIQDPERNGGRSLEDVADHIEHDGLVHWGWDPGPGREPAPYSIAELTSFVNSWAAAGAPCPPLDE